MTVEVRQWSERVYAAYADLGDGRWTLVGTEESRQAARDYALSVLNDPVEVKNRCYNSVFTARRRVLERVSVGQLGEESDGPRVLDNPGPSAPESIDAPGATP